MSRFRNFYWVQSGDKVYLDLDKVIYWRPFGKTEVEVVLEGDHYFTLDISELEFLSIIGGY